jgi:plastocyanin
MATRRVFLRAGGLALAGLAATWADPWVAGARRGRVLAGSARRVAEIRMRSDSRGSHVWFDPVGLLVVPGTTVRWVLEANVHSTTAYHPANGGWAPRIPAGAEPWDSGILTRPGEVFERRFDVPGVYDYYCIPHEMAGMVGRIVVVPEGGARDALREPGPAAGTLRRPSDAALAALPSIESIVRNGSVPPAAPGR